MIVLSQISRKMTPRAHTHIGKTENKRAQQAQPPKKMDGNACTPPAFCPSLTPPSSCPLPDIGTPPCTCPSFTSSSSFLCCAGLRVVLLVLFFFLGSCSCCVKNESLTPSSACSEASSRQGTDSKKATVLLFVLMFVILMLFFGLGCGREEGGDERLKVGTRREHAHNMQKKLNLILPPASLLSHPFL